MITQLSPSRLTPPCLVQVRQFQGLDQQYFALKLQLRASLPFTKKCLGFIHFSSCYYTNITSLHTLPQSIIFIYFIIFKISLNNLLDIDEVTRKPVSSRKQIFRRGCHLSTYTRSSLNSQMTSSDYIQPCDTKQYLGQISSQFCGKRTNTIEVVIYAISGSSTLNTT